MEYLFNQKWFIQLLAEHLMVLDPIGNDALRLFCVNRKCYEAGVERIRYSLSRHDETNKYYVCKTLDDVLDIIPTFKVYGFNLWLTLRKIFIVNNLNHKFFGKDLGKSLSLFFHMLNLIIWTLDIQKL